MIITTDEYKVYIEKAPDSSYYEVKSSKEGLELILHSLELVLFEEFQEFPPEKKTDDTILLTPEALAQWFSFEVLNYGV